MISDNLGQMFQDIKKGQERKGAAYVPKATKVVQDNSQQVTRKPMKASNA